jgi:hypothetical protein
VQRTERKITEEKEVEEEEIKREEDETKGKKQAGGTYGLPMDALPAHGDSSRNVRLHLLVPDWERQCVRGRMVGDLWLAQGVGNGDRWGAMGWCLQGTIPARRGVDAVQKTRGNSWTMRTKGASDRAQKTKREI